MKKLLTALGFVVMVSSCATPIYKELTKDEATLKAYAMKTDSLGEFMRTVHNKEIKSIKEGVYRMRVYTDVRRKEEMLFNLFCESKGGKVLGDRFSSSGFYICMKDGNILYGMKIYSKDRDDYHFYYYEGKGIETFKEEVRNAIEEDARLVVLYRPVTNLMEGDMGVEFKELKFTTGTIVSLEKIRVYVKNISSNPIVVCPTANMIISVKDGNNVLNYSFNINKRVYKSFAPNFAGYLLNPGESLEAYFEIPWETRKAQEFLLKPENVLGVGVFNYSESLETRVCERGDLVKGLWFVSGEKVTELPVTEDFLQFLVDSGIYKPSTPVRSRR